MAESKHEDVSPVINVRSFMQEWIDTLPQYAWSNQKGPKKDFISAELDITDEMYDELSSVCGPHTLDLPNIDISSKSYLWDLLKTVHPEVDLTSTGLHKAELEKCKKYPTYETKMANQAKYRDSHGPWLHDMIRREETPKREVEKPQVILTVRVYKPYERERTPGSKLVPDSEFDVLGCQTLTELRDKIPCINDFMVMGDHSDNPELPQDTVAKDLYKSGYFYIEGTFYNDMRDPNCRDYSEVVRRWAEDPNRGVGPFTSTKMEESTFLDLSLRLGQPYLYTHQGDCEHLMVFTDLRMMHQDDCEDRLKYPIQTMKIPKRAINCRVCQMNKARWVTRGSKLCPEDPGIFCDTCFKSLHYDPDGNKITEFKAFPLPDESWADKV